MKIIKDHLSIKRIEKQLEKLAPVSIECDLSGLSKNKQAATKKLLSAARIMNDIFLAQVYEKNPDILSALQDEGEPEYQVLLKYFLINFGPFDRLDHHRPFINTEEKKPPGANFYPPDLTRPGFIKFVNHHPELKEAFTSNVTLIRRSKGSLTALPFAEAYAGYLEPAAERIKEAARLVENDSLKKYLESRAAAFKTNDYYQSDLDWMDLRDHGLEVVIGPYEVYEDGLLGYKSAFESFITLVDREESDKLQVLENYLTPLEAHLPIEDQYRNFARGSSSPIKVVNAIYSSGDTRAGVQTTAFNLPNDERIREARGSKKVIQKNIARAKFDRCWVPIVQEVLGKKDLKHISFQAYFNHVLLHEMSHGLGPGRINVLGKTTTVGAELKELYGIIEEIKADVLGIYNLQFLIEQGLFNQSWAEHIYASYLGGIFRSVRFGITEAHGAANVIQLNYILEKGGFEFDDQAGRFCLNRKKIRPAVKDLAADILKIQALGDYSGAEKFIRRYRKISAALRLALSRVHHVPVDIFPVYQAEKHIVD